MTINIVRVLIFSANVIAKPFISGLNLFESRLMAQSPPFSDVVLDLNRQHSADETVYSQAANAAITEMSVKLCSGMDSMSVALKLHTKHLLSGNTLEAVRDFQEVTEAKNSRILESVKNAITVVGLQGFMDFLSILGEVHLLRSVVTDLKGT